MRRALAVMILAMLAVVVAAQMIVDGDGVDEAFEAMHTRLRVNSPEGMGFEVTLGGDGSNAYRFGEPIPMRLEFGAGRWINESTRPANTEWDWVVVQSVDGRGEFSDAMAGEFALAVAPSSSCGNYDVSFGALAIQSHLNEWIRFHQHGRYRFFVRSFRTKRQEIVSNIVDLRILPADPGRWQALLREWESGDRAQAARGIRYLGGPDATRFMARRLSEGPGFVQALLNAPPMETLGSLSGVSETFGVRAVQIFRLFAPVTLHAAPAQDQPPGWQRDVRGTIGATYLSALRAFHAWIEPMSD